MEKIIYPEVKKKMELNGEKNKDLAKLLDLDVSQISRKLRGEISWTFGDALILCKHYNTDIYELFRKED